jgi:hypothetical protein
MLSLRTYVMYPAQPTSRPLAVKRRNTEPLSFCPRLGNADAYASDPSGNATSAEREVYSGELRIHLGRCSREHS